MTIRTPSSDTGEDIATGLGPAVEATTGAPRWVKILGVVVLGLAVLLVGLKVTGIGPDHGPGRHGGGSTPATETGGQTPPPGMKHN
jgi:hypothetical protein